MNFRPNEVVNRVTDIKLNSNIKGVLVDLDNTLTRDMESDVEDFAFEFIRNLKAQNIKVYIISNNDRERILPVAKELDVPFIQSAAKPFSKSFLQAAQLMQLKPDQIAVIGDQIFTDILGGNNAGMYTILTKKIHSSEQFKILVKRPLERLIRIILRF